VTGNQKIKLAELVSADLLTGNEAADVGLSLFQLVTGSAAIANGSNLVSIPDLNVTLPAGITNIAVGFSLIEAPVIIGKTVGAVGATRTTKQLSITVTPQINLSSGTLTGLNLTSVTGTLPMTITGGVATGVLTGVRCGADKGIDVNVKPSAANISTSGTLTVSLNSDGTNAGVLKTLGGILTTVVPGQVFTNTITVTGTGVSTAVPAGGYDRSFAYPDEFGPDGSLHVGKTTIGFDNIAYGSSNMTMAVQTLPTLPLLPNVTVNVTAGVTSAGLVTLLQPVLTQLDTKVVQPLMESLGLELGAADIMANSLTCGIPRLG